MDYLLHSNIKDRRLSIMLIMACLIVFVDFFIIFEKEDISGNCLQLAAGADGQLRVRQYSLDIASPVSDIPAKLTPFFFKPLDINLADQETLMVIKGIGPKLSEEIVKYRQLHGPFQSAEDLLRLKGIGRTRAEKFSNVFTFGDLH
jgi:competence ComEA-like helix-hairpin-helix protein